MLVYIVLWTPPVLHERSVKPVEAQAATTLSERL
jgi:hypothetical protein